MSKQSGGFAVTISAIDRASAPLDAINKRLARLSAPAQQFNRALSRFGDVSGLRRVSEGVIELGKVSADAFRGLDRLSSPIASITGAASIACRRRLPPSPAQPRLPASLNCRADGRNSGHRSAPLRTG